MRESEKTILQTLMSASNQQLRWSDLLQKTELSKRTLSLSLKDLQRKGLVKRFVDSHAKEYPPPVYYKLAIEALHMEHTQRGLFSILSMHLFNDILEGVSTGTLTDEEFTRLFTSRIGVLAMYTL
ncbi:MAG: winged helix-turn-helix transcriptional regulator, partial [Candidatus Bathyarchaeota archaeon]|nr:winged helix-turn-helix transcriptional regulator [Candidatus Bathyarchaeota archaeon]